MYELLRRLFHIGNFCFRVQVLKQLLLRNCAVDFVEICNVYVRKKIIKAAKRIFNSDKICRSYSDLNFIVTFFGTQCIIIKPIDRFYHMYRGVVLKRKVTGRLKSEGRMPLKLGRPPRPPPSINQSID